MNIVHSVESAKCVRFEDGDRLDLSGSDEIKMWLENEARMLVIGTEAAVSADGRYGDVVHLSRALEQESPRLSPARARDVRTKLEVGYEALHTHLVIA